MRREGSYIYEEFKPTGGTDVKVVDFSVYFACVMKFYTFTFCKQMNVHVFLVNRPFESLTSLKVFGFVLLGCGLAGKNFEWLVLDLS